MASRFEQVVAPQPGGVVGQDGPVTQVGVPGDVGVVLLGRAEPVQEHQRRTGAGLDECGDLQIDPVDLQGDDDALPAAVAAHASPPFVSCVAGVFVGVWVRALVSRSMASSRVLSSTAKQTRRSNASTRRDGGHVRGLQEVVGQVGGGLPGLQQVADLREGEHAAAGGGAGDAVDGVQRCDEPVASDPAGGSRGGGGVGVGQGCGGGGLVDAGHVGDGGRDVPAGGCRVFGGGDEPSDAPAGHGVGLGDRADGCDVGSVLGRGRCRRDRGLVEGEFGSPPRRRPGGRRAGRAPVGDGAQVVLVVQHAGGVAGVSPKLPPCRGGGPPQNLRCALASRRSGAMSRGPSNPVKHVFGADMLAVPTAKCRRLSCGNCARK